MFLASKRKKRSKSVVVFDFETGEQVTTFDGFQHPCGLCVTDDRLFVADRGANEVRVLDLEGNPLDTIGGGELKIPNDVAVDNCGNVLVMDCGGRVSGFPGSPSWRHQFGWSRLQSGGILVPATRSMYR
eukprot:g31557.t1